MVIPAIIIKDIGARTVIAHTPFIIIKIKLIKKKYGLNDGL